MAIFDSVVNEEKLIAAAKAQLVPEIERLLNNAIRDLEGRVHDVLGTYEVVIEFRRRQS